MGIVSQSTTGSLPKRNVLPSRHMRWSTTTRRQTGGFQPRAFGGSRSVARPDIFAEQSQIRSDLAVLPWRAIGRKAWRSAELGLRRGSPDPVPRSGLRNHHRQIDVLAEADAIGGQIDREVCAAVAAALRAVR